MNSKHFCLWIIPYWFSLFQISSYYFTQCFPSCPLTKLPQTLNFKHLLYQELFFVLSQSPNHKNMIYFIKFILLSQFTLLKNKCWNVEKYFQSSFRFTYLFDINVHKMSQALGVFNETFYDDSPLNKI